MRTTIQNGGAATPESVQNGLVSAQGPMYAAVQEANQLAATLLHTGYDE
jgi:hypothetical protein